MTLTAFRGWHIPWGGQPKIVANTALGGRWASTWTLCIISTVCYCDEWFRVVTVATTLINCGIRVEGPTVVHFTRYHPCSYQYVRPPVHCLASLSTRDGSISLGFKFAASSGERQLPIPSYRCLFLWYNSLYCSSVSFSAAGRLASFPAPTEAMNLQSNAANLSPLPTCAVPRMTAGPVTGADPSWRSEMRWRCWCTGGPWAGSEVSAQAIWRRIGGCWYCCFWYDVGAHWCWMERQGHHRPRRRSHCPRGPIHAISSSMSHCWLLDTLACSHDPTMQWYCNVQGRIVVRWDKVQYDAILVSILLAEAGL